MTRSSIHSLVISTIYRYTSIKMQCSCTKPRILKCKMQCSCTKPRILKCKMQCSCTKPRILKCKMQCSCTKHVHYLRLAVFHVCSLSPFHFVTADSTTNPLSRSSRAPRYKCCEMSCRAWRGNDETIKKMKTNCSVYRS